jgi:hypothetical protein
VCVSHRQIHGNWLLPLITITSTMRLCVEVSNTTKINVKLRRGQESYTKNRTLHLVFPTHESPGVITSETPQPPSVLSEASKMTRHTKHKSKQLLVNATTAKEHTKTKRRLCFHIAKPTLIPLPYLLTSTALPHF